MERDLLGQALALRGDAILFETSARLRAARPGSAIVVTRSGTFDLDAFARAGKCGLSDLPNTESVLQLSQDCDQVWRRSAIHGWRRVCWEGAQLEVVTLTHTWSSFPSDTNWIIAPDDATADRFVAAVCHAAETVEGSLLVFSGGEFRKSGTLYEAIQRASFDDLVLAPKLRDELRVDLERFLSSRALYTRHRIPWKRGLLLLGPPGNGKTCAIRAMLKACGLPVLYAQSFKSDCSPPEDNIQRVFARARALAPAVLVIEDLDGQISDEGRSVFLNELDGFASNEGLVVIASTNHPERLDPALLDRPSRFDRKYHFALPEVPERLRYLERWSEGFEPELKPSAETLRRAAERTGGFSFAYLKELTMGAMMAWADGGGALGMDSVVERVLGSLRQELETASGFVPRVAPVRRIGLRVNGD